MPNPKNSLDLYHEYLSNISVGAVKYASIITGRECIYCSLKRTEPETLDTGEVIQVNKMDVAQQEAESLKDFMERRTQIRDRRATLKELIPDQVNLEPEKGIYNYMDGLDGMQRVEYSEDYDYYQLHCTILRQNQGSTYFAMDTNLQIVLPAYEELTYKRNDKVIFIYQDIEYIYSVIDPPETYLSDVYQLNLKAVTNRPKT